MACALIVCALCVGTWLSAPCGLLCTECLCMWMCMQCLWNKSVPDVFVHTIVWNGLNVTSVKKHVLCVATETPLSWTAVWKLRWKSHTFTNNWPNAFDHHLLSSILAPHIWNGNRRPSPARLTGNTNGHTKQPNLVVLEPNRQEPKYNINENVGRSVEIDFCVGCVMICTIVCCARSERMFGNIHVKNRLPFFSDVIRCFSWVYKLHWNFKKNNTFEYSTNSEVFWCSFPSVCQLLLNMHTWNMERSETHLWNH